MADAFWVFTLSCHSVTLRTCYSVISSGLVTPWSLSLLFIFYFFVATSGVTHCLPKGLFSLINNTSPSHPETMRQKDWSSRGIDPTPVTADHDSCVPSPRSWHSGTSSIPFFVNGQLFFFPSFFVTLCLLGCVHCLDLILGSYSSFLNSTLDGGVFPLSEVEVSSSKQWLLFTHRVNAHRLRHFDRPTDTENGLCLM